jgi:hypothetical protein
MSDTSRAYNAISFRRTLLTPPQAVGQRLVRGWDHRQPARLSLACGKPAFLRCFGDPQRKNRIFPAFFAGFHLRYQKALAIVPSGPDFRCIKGESPQPASSF